MKWICRIKENGDGIVWDIYRDGFYFVIQYKEDGKLVDTIKLEEWVIDGLVQRAYFQKEKSIITV